MENSPKSRKADEKSEKKLGMKSSKDESNRLTLEDVSVEADKVNRLGHIIQGNTTG